MTVQETSANAIRVDASVSEQVDRIPWPEVQNSLNEKGYAVIRQFFAPLQCDEFRTHYAEPGRYRKTVVMERFRFGLGEYKYFNYPLPALLQSVRESLYGKLASVANEWMRVLGLAKRFPATHAELIAECRSKGQMHPTPLILKYGAGGYNTLHQDLYGDVYFPIQAVAILTEPGRDFTGGEFVLTQQNPRAQSKAIVLNPEKGDLVIFTTSFRPAKGRNGYHRVYVKHGVSEVHKGERYTLGIIFHDALT